MSKFVKGHIIGELEDQLRQLTEVLVIDMSRLTGNQANSLRVKLRQKNISFMTVKNSLARRACLNIGLGSLCSSLEGSATLVWGGEDIVALSREITDWCKTLDKLELRGGTVEGQSLNADGVVHLSKSPGRPELLAKIAGLLLSPGGNLVGAILGPGGKVAGQITSLAEGDTE